MHKKILYYLWEVDRNIVYVFGLFSFEFNSIFNVCLFFIPLGGTAEPDACTWSIYWAKAFVWPENPPFRHCLFSHQTQHLS